MNKINPPLAKICTECGLNKPVSAFLQFADQEGTTYGNKCATCRNAGKDDDDDRGTSVGVGLRIHAREKVAMDIAAQKLVAETNELYHTDRQKNDQQDAKQAQQKKATAFGDTKRRESLLSRSFYSENNTSNPTVPTTAAINHALTQNPNVVQTISATGMQIPQISFMGDAVKRLASTLGPDSPLSRMLGSHSTVTKMFGESIDKLSQKVNTDTQKGGEELPATPVSNTYRKSR